MARLKINFDKMDRKLSEVVRTVDKITGKILKETAEQAIKTIVSRTRRKSQDKDGKSFRRYSSQYSEQKRKAGANNNVNLTSTGQRRGGKGPLKGNRQGGTMMNSLAIIRVEDGKTRYIVGAARRIEQEKLTRHVRGSGNLPKRNPMGFTNKENEVLVKRASRQYLDKIRKIGLK